MSVPPTQRRNKPVFKTAAPDDQEKFKPLPKPTGIYPYHLDIKQVAVGDNTNNGENSEKMVFHICGDTGGIVLPTFQHQVVREMTRQYHEASTDEDRPLFFFHLGDVVYNFGQAEGYDQQFFAPFDEYPAPVFAIAGNHDGDIDPFNPNKPQSLDAFIQVFCDTEPRTLPFAGNSNTRKSNIQPNVYWTLKTPLANIICLYGNTPRFGTITPDQREWFINELKNANHDEGKAIIVCVHNSAYSGDTNHGSSLNMQLFLNGAFEETGVVPDVIFSGHVHNYQRINKLYPNKKIVPFVVAGAGGYAQLHKIADINDPAFPDTSPLFNDVVLENYCDDAHGFLKITLEKLDEKVKLHGEYFIINDGDVDSKAVLFDKFSV